MPKKAWSAAALQSVQTCSFIIPPGGSVERLEPQMSTITATIEAMPGLKQFDIDLCFDMKADEIRQDFILELLLALHKHPSQPKVSCTFDLRCEPNDQWAAFNLLSASYAPLFGVVAGLDVVLQCKDASLHGLSRQTGPVLPWNSLDIVCDFRPNSMDFSTWLMPESLRCMSLRYSDHFDAPCWQLLELVAPYLEELVYHDSRCLRSAARVESISFPRLRSLSLAALDDKALYTFVGSIYADHVTALRINVKSFSCEVSQCRAQLFQIVFRFPDLRHLDANVEVVVRAGAKGKDLADTTLVLDTVERMATGFFAYDIHFALHLQLHAPMDQSHWQVSQFDGLPLQSINLHLHNDGPPPAFPLPISVIPTFDQLRSLLVSLERRPEDVGSEQSLRSVLAFEAPLLERIQLRSSGCKDDQKWLDMARYIGRRVFPKLRKFEGQGLPQADDPNGVEGLFSVACRDAGVDWSRYCDR